ncbi:ABC transporter ATP-binding protein [Futiania mangrovi]|uniref:ABC transporter ATP-binding protein n=1 Tax=Futiania mangrovi TaxID=2959716 RepID=A0A9J6P7X8_9PROT|nr:ABC transporter ATP-binding protein [Futiania mangrovii]MCP1335428.1 ABC transporter ATP-binding protein [Futiania mangrovii]
MTQADPPAPLRLSLTGITRRFGALVANDAVDLDVGAGEIHALLGENGAGKSTLVKIVYGLLQPDSGTMRWEGRPVRLASPAEARALGIAMVFQHFSLFDALTVLENIAAGLDGQRADAALAARVRDLGRRYGLDLDPDATVADLSVGERQRVEIVRALLQEPRLLIMDEPTSVLTPQEAERLFDTLRALRAEGVSILYISHRLSELKALCDRATVLRGGKVVATLDPRAVEPEELAAAMIGRELEKAQRLTERRAELHHARAGGGQPPILEIAHLSMGEIGPHRTPLHDVSFAVRAGEVFGIAGVAGNGQGALMAALVGEALAPEAEMVRIRGEAVGRMGAARRRHLLAAFAPEERLGHGSVPELTLGENMVLTDPGGQGGFVRGRVVRYAEAARKAGDVIARFGVVARGPETPAASLSGGNLQKFIIGRELAKAPAVFVANQPTWGVDAGAAQAIHRTLIDLADAGSAVVVISQDLDELLILSDRIAALCAGRLSPPIPREEATPEKLGLMMGGAFEAARETEAADADA